jgi:hypothetical protein
MVSQNYYRNSVLSKIIHSNESSVNNIVFICTIFLNRYEAMTSNMYFYVVVIVGKILSPKIGFPDHQIIIIIYSLFNCVLQLLNQQERSNKKYPSVTTSNIPFPAECVIQYPSLDCVRSSIHLP